MYVHHSLEKQSTQIGRTWCVCMFWACIHFFCVHKHNYIFVCVCVCEMIVVLCMCMDVCAIVYVSLWPLLWPFSLVTAWVLNYSWVYVCLCVLCAAYAPLYMCECVVVCLCVEEMVSFCGFSNQPPAHSPNTCSPINIQCAGTLSLLLPSHCFLPFFFLLYFFLALFSSTLDGAQPFHYFHSFSHMPTVHLLFLSLLLNSLASLLFPSHNHLLHHHHSPPLACLILP